MKAALKMVQKSKKALDCVFLSFELQSALQANANKKFEIMGETGNQGEKFLCYAELPHSSLLCL